MEPVSDDNAYCDPINGGVIGKRGSTVELVESKNVANKPRVLLDDGVPKD